MRVWALEGERVGGVARSLVKVCSSDPSDPSFGSVGYTESGVRRAADTSNGTAGNFTT